MRKVLHNLGHLLWWMAYFIDPEGTPTYKYCECRSDKCELQQQREVW